jgi:hypothetical protein
MSEPTQGDTKALILLTALRWQRQQNVPVDSPMLFHRREAIIRKADELGVDIIEEFVFPTQYDMVAHPLFSEMLYVIAQRRISYVVIYPERPHRNRERSAAIIAAINRAGAQVVSASDVTGIGELAEFFVYLVGDFDTYARQRDAQRKRQREQQKRETDAAVNAWRSRLRAHPKGKKAA